MRILSSNEYNEPNKRRIRVYIIPCPSCHHVFEANEEEATTIKTVGIFDKQKRIQFKCPVCSAKLESNYNAYDRKETLEG